MSVSKWFLASLACALALALALAAHATRAAPADRDGERRVVEILQGAHAYQREGERFAAAGDAAGQVVLPAVVREESPRGFVRVDGGTGPLWLDELDVVIDPPRTAMNADCTIRVSGDASMQVAATRAAGEGCAR